MTEQEKSRVEALQAHMNALNEQLRALEAWQVGSRIRLTDEYLAAAREMHDILVEL